MVGGWNKHSGIGMFIFKFVSGWWGYDCYRSECLPFYASTMQIFGVKKKKKNYD